jgi:hypothetical protein
MDGSGQESGKGERGPEGLRKPKPASDGPPPEEMISFQERQFARYLAQIRDPAARRSVAALTRALASDREDDAQCARPPNREEAIDAFRSIGDADTRDSVMRLVMSLAASGG